MVSLVLPPASLGLQAASRASAAAAAAVRRTIVPTCVSFPQITPARTAYATACGRLRKLSRLVMA